MTKATTTARKPAARKPAAKATTKAEASQPPSTPLLEWIAAGVGLALVLAVMALLIAESLIGDHSPPEIVARQVATSWTAAGYLVEIEVSNSGGTTAGQVAIEGELVAPGAQAETAEAVFDYVPAHSTRKGGLYFKDDPRTGQLTLTAKGYIDP